MSFHSEKRSSSTAVVAWSSARTHAVPSPPARPPACRVPPVVQNLFLGAVSGMAAAIIMTPVDVVKTRLMTGSATGGIVSVMEARRNRLCTLPVQSTHGLV